MRYKPGLWILILFSLQSLIMTTVFIKYSMHIQLGDSTTVWETLHRLFIQNLSVREDESL